MSSLDDFIKKNSKFLKLGEGESFEGIYEAHKTSPSTFDPEKETVVYTLRYMDGHKIFWQTSSVKVARFISKLDPGNKLKIKRIGTGTNTKYEISSPDILEIDDSELKPDDEVPF